MKYKIDWIEEKSWNGKKFLEVELEGHEGKKISVWPPFPVDTLKPSDEIEGDLVQNDKGYWSLKPLKANPFANKPAWAQKSNTIAKAQETKREDIKTAQENRKEGVMIASTARDATQIALAELSGKPLVAQEFQDRWDYWQKWLAERWKNLELGF